MSRPHHRYFRPAMASMLLAGCGTGHDGFPSVRALDAHRGKWSLEDAVDQLGPPVSTLELGDHSTIAEWYAGPEASPSFSFRVESSDGEQGRTSERVQSGVGSRVYRQLQFDQGGRLVEVRDVSRVSAEP